MTDLWEHQVAALDWLATNPRAGLSIPMGGGKSRVICEHITKLNPRRVLILCPAAVVSTWVRELGTWVPHAVPIALGSGKTIAERNSILRGIRRADQTHDGATPDRLWIPLVVIVNLEALGLGLIERASDRLARAEAELEEAIGANYVISWDYHERRVKRARESLDAAKTAGELDDHLLEIDWDLVVVDECHRVKAPTGTIQRSVRRLAKRSPSLILQSGTWMPHDPRDVFAPIRMIDEETFGTAFGRFEQLITCFKGPQMKWENGYRIDPDHPRDCRLCGGYDEALADWFAASVHKHVFVVPELDLGLDDPIPSFRTHELPPKVRMLYDQLEEEMAIDLEAYRHAPERLEEEDFTYIPETGTVLPPNTLVRLLRLAQLASGGLPLDDSEEKITHTARFELLADTMSDIGDEPTVIGCRFKHELEFARRAAEKHGRSYGEISGRRKDGLDHEGRMAPVDVVGVQYQSGGVGIDLSRSSLAVVIGHMHNLGLYDQFVGREHRPGQQRTVRVVHLIAEDTVDEPTYDALSTRRDVVSTVTRSVINSRSVRGG
jgi:superfamily II DNA or RNA helicase